MPPLKDTDRLEPVAWPGYWAAPREWCLEVPTLLLLADWQSSQRTISTLSSIVPGAVGGLFHPPRCVARLEKAGESTDQGTDGHTSEDTQRRTVPPPRTDPGVTSRAVERPAAEVVAPHGLVAKP